MDYTEDNPIKFDITFRDESPEDLIYLLKEAKAKHVKKIEQRGLTGMETAVIGMLVVSAFSNLISKLSQLWKCGVIVDARGSKVLTEKNCDLPRGSVLVIAPDGTESTLREPTEVQISALIAEVAKART